MNNKDKLKLMRGITKTAIATLTANRSGEKMSETVKPQIQQATDNVAMQNSLTKGQRLLKAPPPGVAGKARKLLAAKTVGGMGTGVPKIKVSAADKKALLKQAMITKLADPRRMLFRKGLEKGVQYLGYGNQAVKPQIAKNVATVTKPVQQNLKGSFREGFREGAKYHPQRVALQEARGANQALRQGVDDVAAKTGITTAGQTPRLFLNAAPSAKEIPKGFKTQVTNVPGYKGALKDTSGRTIRSRARYKDISGEIIRSGGKRVVVRYPARTFTRPPGGHIRTGLKDVQYVMKPGTQKLYTDSMKNVARNELARSAGRVVGTAKGWGKDIARGTARLALGPKGVLAKAPGVMAKGFGGGAVLGGGLHQYHQGLGNFKGLGDSMLSGGKEVSGYSWLRGKAGGGDYRINPATGKRYAKELDFGAPTMHKAMKSYGPPKDVPIEQMTTQQLSARGLDPKAQVYKKNYGTPAKANMSLRNGGSNWEFNDKWQIVAKGQGTKPVSSLDKAIQTGQ